MISFPQKERYDFDDFRQIIALLRHPGGCPWDQAQDHQSIRRNFIEEVYEVCEGIDTDNPALLREELGDVLMQVLFHASIEEDAGRFSVDDVIDQSVRKLLFRHPHVFAAAAPTSNWDELKRQEKGQTSQAEVLNAVARTLPALWRAEKVQHKAAKVGFDWPQVGPAMEKVSEETAELQQAITDHSNVEEELGDLLFAAVNVARFLHIDPENALNRATDKFIARFAQVEASTNGADLRTLSLPQLEALWQQAKQQEEPHE